MAKEIAVSVDLEQLKQQLEEQRREDDFSDNDNFSVRTSIFTLGKDPRISQDRYSAPDLTNIEILKDGLNNPYFQINWEIPREDIDSGKVTGFEVYKRAIPADQALNMVSVTEYNQNAFTRISQKSKKTGKFSSEKKAINNIRKDMITLPNLNNNLALLNAKQQNSFYSNNTTVGYNQSFDLRNYLYTKIAKIDYSKFLAQEKQKFLFVQDRNIVSLYFRDKAVAFGGTYEYYVQTITKELGKDLKSNSVVLTLEDLTPVEPPVTLSIKQIREDELQILVSLHTNSKPERIFVYRKSEDQIDFELLGQIPASTDNLIVTDAGIRYGKTYTYRVFVQNIHGLLSEPREITFYSSVQRITPETRSNNLRQPVFSVIQDQNSDFIKINIFPNDPLVSYYSLERRDLTIRESKFTVPSKINTNYGGDGWTTNQFFVEKIREQVSGSSNFSSKMTFKQIDFVDDTVEIDHLYQYRLRGYDLFGNGTSYSFGLVKAEGKKKLRTPINVRKEIIRGYPFRVKISWDDDNLATVMSQQDLTGDKKEVKIVFKVQRRKIDENVYESFPLTANPFIIDEVATLDAINFDGQAFASGAFDKAVNLEINETQAVEASKLRRAFDLPNFLIDNSTYFYRVSAYSVDLGDQSNSTEEFSLLTVADISPPIEFKAEVINNHVRPLVSRLTWKNDVTKAKPDRWIIERKVDTDNEPFRTVGISYLETQFLDFNLPAGSTYIYRIKSLDTIGRVTDYVEARLSV